MRSPDFASTYHSLAWTLARLHLERDRPSARTLLLLRVFGYTKRTERLFDRIAARWRFCGPVTMIAAPDVIARTVDPEDFLRYLTGRLSSTFVQSREDLDKRLAALDRKPDPDGRYRINEFCCRDNTWQATVVELMSRADAVVMDLRGVTAKHRGCEFELQQLAARLHPERIVLVVDQSTPLYRQCHIRTRRRPITSPRRGSSQQSARDESGVCTLDCGRVWPATRQLSYRASSGFVKFAMTAIS